MAQSVRHLTQELEGQGLLPGPATHLHFSFCLFKKSNCQLLAKVCAQSLVNFLGRSKPAQEKCLVVKLTDCPDMILAVYHGHKTRANTPL